MIFKYRLCKFGKEYVVAKIDIRIDHLEKNNDNNNKIEKRH